MNILVVVLAIVALVNIGAIVHVNDVFPASYFKEKRVVNGYIVSIIDGDTYKFHPATLWERYFGISNMDSVISVSVRIAAVDTPETPKRGQPGQPFSIEAKEFAKKKLEGKYVSLKLLNLDRYGRVLGVVRYRDGLRLNVDIAEELLREGLAVIYRQGGAQYDGRLATYTKLEENAINSRKGIWMNGQGQAELPSTYKQGRRRKKKTSEVVL